VLCHRMTQIWVREHDIANYFMGNPQTIMSDIMTAAREAVANLSRAPADDAEYKFFSDLLGYTG